MSDTYSYWEKSQFFRYDVIVAGSGIVGLNAAIRLKEKQPKLSVAVLESGFLPTGASTKNAGFACFGSISELIEQEKICGADELALLISRRWNGLKRLKLILGAGAIDYKNYGGYEIFTEKEDVSFNECVVKLDHYNQMVHAITGSANAFAESNGEIEKFGFNGVKYMLKNSLESQIDTGKMMHALIQTASKMGVFIFNSCRIDGFENQSGGIEILTAQGNFFAKKLIICTNAFTKFLLPHIDLVPGRGQVLVTREIKNLKIKGTFHYQKGYYYFRNIHNRLLIGGGRNLDFKSEETTHFGTTPLIQEALKEIIDCLILPDQEYIIDRAWSGIMAFGPVLSPIIEEVHPNIFCAVRSNGMGIAMGSLTGADVADLALQKL